jgi:hypothetical protein
MKTSELTGPALRYAVAVAGDWNGARTHANVPVMIEVQGYRPDLLWGQGGPIIEREEICILDKLDLTTWVCQLARARTRDGADEFRRYYRQTGSTPLIAAMRCFVASKLGDEVEIPKDLL